MKIKILFLIGLTFTLVYTYGQDLINRKSVTIICTGRLGNCSCKAFKIVSNEVQIDTCFDNNKKIFTVDKKTLVESNSLFSQIIAMTTTNWQDIQNDLDKISNCDYAVPFEVIISDNYTTETYSLKRFMNCYPTSSKQLLERLDDYFNKMFFK